jgi:hypothetical protein
LSHSELLLILLGEVEISKFINENFRSLGVLPTANVIGLISQALPDIVSMPSLFVLRKDRLDKFEAVATLALASDSDVDAGQIMGFLQDGHRVFGERKIDDAEFITQFKIKNQERARWLFDKNKLIRQNIEYSLNENYAWGNPIPNQDQRFQEFQAPPAHAIPQNRRSENLRPSNAHSPGNPLVQERLEREEQDRKYKELIRENENAEKERVLKVMEQKAKSDQEAAQKLQTAQSKDRLREGFKIEPSPGDNVLTCGFRLPNGSKINRRFLKISKLQELHDFVWIQEDIGFEEENPKFDLLNGFPRGPISDLTQTLGEKFPTGKQELFLVNPK